MNYLLLFAQTDSAVIYSEHDFIDIGVIYEADGKVLVEVFYKNTGNSPLNISKIYSSDLELKEYNRDGILPGMTEKVILELNPFSKVGYYEKEVIIFSNAVNSPLSINVRGKIIGGSHVNKFKYHIGGISFKQLQLNFGYIYKGNELIRYIPVHNASSEPLKVIFGELPPYLDIKLEFDTLNVGKTGIIEVKYNTNLCNDWDFVIDKVDVTVIGKEKVTGNVTFTSNIRENFSLLSEEQFQNRPIADIPVRVYDFDTISGNELVKFSCLLVNKGNKTLNIRALKPTCGCTAALSDTNLLQPGDSTFINVEFNSTGYSGMTKQGVSIITNDPENYKQFIWIAGVIK